MKHGVETLHVGADTAPESPVMPGAVIGNPVSPVSAAEIRKDDGVAELEESGRLGADNKPIAEFGNRNVVEIPRNVINVLPQIRRQFDPVKLQELADSMPLAKDANGLVHELMEPVVEGLHTKESAERYLEQYNRANQDNDHMYIIDDLVPWQTEKGIRYVIHIAGERRIRAADILIEKHGYSSESRILSSVHENITYVDALPMQFMENNARVNPPKPDEARSMRGYIDLMREIDPKYTQKKCAAKFAVRPEVVHDAMVFTSYPPSMQALEKFYPYNWVVGADGIYNTWLEYYRQHKYGVADSMAVGLLREDHKVAVDDGLGMWTTVAGDGLACFESAEDAAAHETELCLLKIKAEQLARKASLRKNEVRKARDVRLPAQLAAIKKLLADEAAGVGQDAYDETVGLTDQELYRRELIMKMEAAAGVKNEDRLKADDQLKFFETYAKRRTVASNALFEAVIGALWLLDARGDLANSMRNRLGGYALAQAAIGEDMSDISQEDSLFDIAS